MINNWEYWKDGNAMGKIDTNKGNNSNLHLLYTPLSSTLNQD